jgi:hypothetical protein
MAERRLAESTEFGAFGPTTVEAPKGFATSASRTISAEVERVFAAWTDEAKRRQWCRNDQLVITETTPSISLHGDWGASHVRVYFMPRGACRANVTVDQGELPTARKAEQMKKFWQARLGRLAAALETSKS